MYPLSGIAATRNGNVPCSRIVRVLAQVGRPLADLHRSGRVHGNISIDSVGLDGVGHAYLMTAATDSPRSAGDTALRDGRASGYNAFEQYTDDPQWRVGPWTDVYALCAVAYRLTTGAPPPSAIDRCVRDSLGSLAERAIKGYPLGFLEAIDRGLALRPQDRFESVQALLIALGVDEQAVRALPPVSGVSTGPASGQLTAHPPVHSAAHLTAAIHQSVVNPAPASSASLPVAASRQPVHGPERVASEVGAGKEADRPARAWFWAAWPVGLASAAMVGYLWLGTEAASPQINVRAPTGSDTRSVQASISPATSSSAEARTHSAPAIPPDIFSQNVSEPAPAALAQPSRQDASNPPLVASAGSTLIGVEGAVSDDKRATANLGTGNSAEEILGEKAVKPVSAVRVAVDIRPWGEVFVDGASRGVSPPLRQLNLLPGSYQITVRNPNAPSYSKRVSISPGQRSVAITHQFGSP